MHGLPYITRSNAEAVKKHAEKIAADEQTKINNAASAALFEQNVAESLAKQNAKQH